jgi:tocopherol cyclase
MWRPDLFQGAGRRRRYFEGYYFKHVAPDGTAYSVIPGVSRGADGSGHSFIQLIRGADGSSRYYRYPLEAFRAEGDELFLQVGESRFSRTGVRLKAGTGSQTVQGSVDYASSVGFPRSILSPGVMGWYSFVPFMECYHGVVSVDHGLRGALLVDGREVSFDGGQGYIEKDWGASMPSAWVWMQTNSFADRRASFMASVARIPWLGGSFVGFLGFLWFHGRFHRFATYTGARLRRLSVEGHEVRVEIADADVVLDVRGERSGEGSLQAPVLGLMDRRIAESLNARLDIRLRAADGADLFHATGSAAGLEVVGDVETLEP